MKRGRKTKSTSGYVMNTHKNGNYLYAYTLRPFTVEDKVVYRRCQWGRLDENNKFIPGLSFMRLPDEEKVKFVFPQDWDTSEVSSLLGGTKLNGASEISRSKSSSSSDYLHVDSSNGGNPDYVKQLLEEHAEETMDLNSIESLSKYYIEPTTVKGVGSNGNMLSGATWLIEIWAKKIGLLDDLTQAFDEDQYKVDVFMALVIYAMTHNYSLDNFFTTQAYIKYPVSEILGEIELGKINKSTSDREFEKFFEKWMERSLDENVCAFDSTLTGDMHTDSNPLGIKGNVFRHGYDIEDALKSEFIILYSLTTGYPLCYATYGEDNDDLRSFYDALSRLKIFGAKDFLLFTNRIYDGVHLLLELLASEGQKLLIPTDVTSPDIEKTILEITIEDHLPTGMQWNENGDVYYTQIRTDFYSGRLIGPDSRIDLYYSPEKDMRDRMKVMHRIGNMNSHVESLVGQSNMVIKDDFSKANNLIDIEYTAATSDLKFSIVKSGSVNKDKVAELIRLCGFYAARTFNTSMNPKDVLKIFRFASEHKTDFGILKDILNLQRPYNDDRLPVLKKIIQGKRFVLFLVLIISASLKRVIKSRPMLSKVFRDDTQMIMEMLSLQGEYKDGKLVGCSELTPRQRLIVSELHLDQCPGKEMSDVTEILYQKIHEEKTSDKA